MADFAKDKDFATLSEAERRGFYYALDYFEAWAQQIEETAIHGRSPENMQISMETHLKSSSQLVLALVRATRMEMSKHSGSN